MAGMLLAIWMLAANQHLEELIGSTGTGDAQHSAMVRQGMASTATQAAEVARANIEAAKEIIDAAGKGWATTPPSEANVEEVLTQAIGPARDATTAATEVTKAAVGGTNGVRPVVEDRGYNLITRWRTEKDDRVCPVCRPLDGKVPDLWEPVLRTLVAPGGTRAISQIVANGGPPAHPNCRCYLTTQAEPAAKRVRR
jgi:flagellar hook-basal body complex protein FliE